MIAALLFASLVAAPVPSAATSPILELRDAVERALEGNHQVEGARAEVDAARASVDLARAPLRPLVDLDGRITRNEPPAVFPFGDQEISVLPRDDWEAALRLRQQIYDGGRRRTAVRQARLGVDAADDDLRGAEEDLVARVVVDYLAAVRADALADVERRSVELAASRQRRAESFFDAGEVTRVDVLRAAAARKDAERRLVLAERQRESALSRLRVALATADPFAVAAPRGVLGDALDEEMLVRRALEAHPELAAARVRLAVAGLEITRRKSERRPELHLEAAFVRQNRTFPSDSFGSAALLFNVPLFQGGATAAGVELARQRERQARLAVDGLELAVRESIGRALGDVEAAGVRLELARELLVAVEAEHEQIADLYAALEATSLDVETAELSLADARRAVVDGELELELARAQAWRAAGLLKTAILNGDSK